MEKKEQNSQKKMLTFLYTASTFLVLVILVIGVTMMNNYDRMTNMETAIHQISQTLDQESTEQNQDTLEQQATEENQEALANQEAAGIAAEELGEAMRTLRRQPGMMGKALRKKLPVRVQKKI